MSDWNDPGLVMVLVSKDSLGGTLGEVAFNVLPVPGDMGRPVYVAKPTPLSKPVPVPKPKPKPKKK